MDFEEAYFKILEASKEKDSVEIPTILSCVDFSGKRCLEIGCGPIARLAVEVVKAGAEQVICLENYDKTVEKAKKEVDELGLSDKVDIQMFKKGESYKLPFSDEEFDVVYGAWLPHALTTNQDFLDEIVRVSGKSILLVMPGIDDDLVRMKSIVYPSEKERREEYRKEIVDYLESKGINVKLKEAFLRLDFDSFEDIKGVFDVFDFSKGYDGKEEGVDDFLRDKMHNMQDGFYCVVGEK